MEQRDACLQAAMSQLAGWNAEIARLEAQAEASHADTWIRLRQHIDQMRRERNRAARNLQDLRRCRELTWEFMNSDIGGAWNSITESFECARERFFLVWRTARPLPRGRVILKRSGGDMDSTTVTKPEVHAVVAANHVNPKL